MVLETLTILHHNYGHFCQRNFFKSNARQWICNEFVQNVCTEPSISLTYMLLSWYFLWFKLWLLLIKIVIIHLTDMSNNNNRSTLTACGILLRSTVNSEESPTYSGIPCINLLLLLILMVLFYLFIFVIVFF